MSWDDMRASLVADYLPDGIGNKECAGLFSVTVNESGAWLMTLPVTALDLKIDLVIVLHLGTQV